jgi:alpha-tubulin suppressor-like RCC1 family protein
MASLIATALPTAASGVPPVVPLSAGAFHSCALTAAGGVQCWGAGGDGALGNGTFDNSNTPVDVTGLTSDVAAISAGWYHTCALTTAGGVMCWGDNSGGQLGNGTFIRSNVPVPVTGLTSGVAAISGGGFHTCAVTTSGGVKCWGANGDGQLGDGTKTNRNTAVDVPALTSGATTIAAGFGHTCAVTTTGGVKCWGANASGQLGHGQLVTLGNVTFPDLTDRSTPVDVPALTTGVAAITAGEGHTCSLAINGNVHCWGDNAYGQVGDGTFDNRIVPVFVAGLTDVAAISSHGIHTCALTMTGGVNCWGIFAGGPPALSSGVAAIAAGYQHSCALLPSGVVTCWGRNDFGQLGNSTMNTFISGFESLSELAAAGGSVTTDREPDGATPGDPIEVTVTTPNAGTVSITESLRLPISAIDLGLLVQITAPAATAQNPLQITFTLDQSALPAGTTASSIVVKRNSVLVRDCPGASSAIPDDPCVSSRRTLGDDVVITILTSGASSWEFEMGAALVIRHIVINDNGGTLTCSSFSFQVNGSSVTPADADCETSVTVEAGTYTVSQPPVAGYTATDSGCSNVVLAAGSTATCTITNDDQPAPSSFTGFFGPVHNAPVVNMVKGGQAVPIKFSLAGDRGLAIFADGYPTSQAITCDTSAPLGNVEETVTAGASTLSYDPSTDQYVYVWKTSTTWAQSCRRLTIRLADGSEHGALFTFK